VKPFLPVVGYLYRTVDKAVFLCPGTEYIAASLFMCCPGGIEITTVYGCNATVLEFGIQPGYSEILDIVDRGLVDVVFMTPGLDLRPETAWVISFRGVCVGYWPVRSKDGDGSVCGSERKAREYSKVGAVTLAGEETGTPFLIDNAEESSNQRTGSGLTGAVFFGEWCVVYSGERSEYGFRALF
jgi:hypothetical protein